MNDSTSLQRQLELATARHLPAGAELSAETSELREGWLALAAELEQQPERDAALFAAQVAGQWTAAPSTRRRRRTALAVAGACAAIAAALLLAVTVWIAFQPEQHQQQIVASEAAQQSPAASGDVEFDSRFASAAAWDDPLDSRIAQMQQDVADMSRNKRGLDDSLSALDRKLAELASDLDAGSL